MSQKFDPVDVVGAGCWDVISRFFYYIASIFMGCGIASFSIHTTDIIDKPWKPLLYFFAGPLHLVSIWLFFAFPVLIAGVIYIIRSDEPQPARCVAFATTLGLFCMLGYRSEMATPWISWLTWVMLSAMLATASRFWMKWQRSRWVCEMAELKAENELRRQELRDKFGTGSSNMYDIDET